MNPVLQLSAQDWLSLFNHFASLSLLAVGGAITAAPEMHRYLVDETHWPVSYTHLTLPTICSV